MSALSAFVDGIRRVRRAPWLLLAMWGTSLLAALPLAMLLGAQIEQDLGASLAADVAADHVNADWWSEFRERGTGVARTFVPAIIGFAAVLQNLSAVLDAQPPAPALLLAMLAHAGLATFLLGGVIDRLARDRTVTAREFFGACGWLFGRLLRLTCLGLAAYVAAYAIVHRGLFGDLLPWWTHDSTSERNTALTRLLLYLLFGVGVCGLNLLFDYAKVRLVVEDRRSVLFALVASARFLRRNLAAAAGVYLLDAGMFLLALLLYASLAPAPGGAATTMAGFAIGQLFLVARSAVRLQFIASEVALFQGRLAHAGYLASRPERWPESPSGELIRPELPPERQGLPVRNSN